MTTVYLFGRRSLMMALRKYLSFLVINSFYLYVGIKNQSTNSNKNIPKKVVNFTDHMKRRQSGHIPGRSDTLIVLVAIADVVSASPASLLVSG